MKKKILVLMLASMLAASCVACGSKSSDHKKDKVSTSATEMVTETETETEQIEEQDITSDALTPLADAGVITGVKDITVEEGTDVQLNDFVYADSTIVKSVDVDDSAADYSKAGTYNVIYTIAFDGAKLRDYVKDNHLMVSFNTDSATVVVKTTVTVTVATKEDTEKAIANGDTNVVTEETKESVKNDNKAKANDNAVVSTPGKNSGTNTGNAGNTNSGNTAANTGSNNNGSVNNNGAASGTNNSGNTKPADTLKNDTPNTPSQHTHNYVEVSRTNPTCTADGVITKKCSCGATITESNGNALGHHMVHHDAITHTEQRLVSDAYDEPVYKNGYVCNACGAFFDTDDEALDHTLFECVRTATYSTADNVVVGYKHHDAVYETVTVTDTPAYDECDRCGARS